MRKFHKGQMMVELILALGLAAVFIPVVLNGFLSLPRENIQERKIEALALLLEAKEAVRIAKERDWHQVASDGTYYPKINRNTWEMIPGTETINGFTRKIEIDSVQRELNSDIVSSGGEIDPSMKKVTVSVSWSKPFSSQLLSTTYFSRYLGNEIYRQTSRDDFSSGNLSNVEVADTYGGEVVLTQVCGSYFSADPTPTPGFTLCRPPYQCVAEDECDNEEANVAPLDCGGLLVPRLTCCKCLPTQLAYAPDGLFESSTFDAYRDVAFNRIKITTNQPAGTEIKYQISLKKGQGGSCAGVTPVFVGPDKKEDSFFEDSAPIPFENKGDDFQNPGQCFAYRVYLTSSTSDQTPVFYDLTVNFSP